MIKRTIIFLVAILVINIMAYGQEQENKKALIFLTVNIFPQAYLQNDMPMVPLEAILNGRYSHTFFKYSYKKEKNKIILQNTSGIDVRTTTRLKKDEFIIINLATNQFVVKNRAYNFSRVPQIIDGNTYVPADFFLTAFGYPIAVDVNYVYIDYNVEKVCTAKDMILYVEKKSGFALTLELTEEEWEKGISDVWKFDIEPTNGIFLYEVMPVIRGEVVMHSWGYRNVDPETGKGGDYYEEDTYNKPQNCYVFKTPKAGKYEMTVSNGNGVSTYMYLINVVR